MRVVFGIVDIMMNFAPIGVFGAMAFTVGQYGLRSLGPLAKLIGTFSGVQTVIHVECSR